MANRYWKGANLGNWTTNSNWSSDLAGTVNSTAPTASDTAFLNASSVTGARLVYVVAPVDPAVRAVYGIVANQSLVSFQMVGGSSAISENLNMAIGAGGILMQAGSGPLTIGNDGTTRKISLVNLSSDILITNESSSLLTIANVFSGGMQVSTTGTGNVAFKKGGSSPGYFLTVTGNANGGAAIFDVDVGARVFINSGWLQLSYDPLDSAP